MMAVNRAIAQNHVHSNQFFSQRFRQTTVTLHLNVIQLIKLSLFKQSLNRYKFTRLKLFFVQTASCIRCNQICYSNQFHYTNWHATFGQWVSFIVVKTPLHAHHRHIIYCTKNQLTGMSFNSRYGEIWYALIRDNIGIFNTFS